MLNTSVTTTLAIPDENLEKADDILRELSLLITDSVPSKYRRLLKEIAFFHEDNRGEREQTARRIEQITARKSELFKLIQSRKRELERKKRSILDLDKRSLSMDDVVRYLQFESEIQSNELSALEDRLRGRQERLKREFTELKRISSRRVEAICGYNDMVMENNRVSRPDISSQIKMDIKAVISEKRSKERVTRQFLGLTKGCRLNLASEIDKRKTELSEIGSKIGKLGEMISETKLESEPKTGKRATKRYPGVSEIEKMVNQVRNVIDGKKERLRQLELYNGEFENLIARERTLNLKLEGEAIKREKQRKRVETIKRAGDELKKIEKKSRQLNDSISRLVREIKRLSNKRLSWVEDAKKKKDKTREMCDVFQRLNKLEEELYDLESEESTLVHPKEMWFNDIERRIIGIREKIGLGGFGTVLLFPHRAIRRYRLGKYIRRGVIETERELNDLGILSQEYLEKVDIFNRKDINGNQLSLDILEYN